MSSGSVYHSLVLCVCPAGACLHWYFPHWRGPFLGSLYASLVSSELPVGSASLGLTAHACAPTYLNHTPSVRGTSTRPVTRLEISKLSGTSASYFPQLVIKPTHLQITLKSIPFSLFLSLSPPPPQVVAELSPHPHSLGFPSSSVSSQQGLRKRWTGVGESVGLCSDLSASP